MKISELQQTNPVLYDTDKFGKSSWTKLPQGHSYAGFYDEFFSMIQDWQPLKVLEIGIKYGGSVRLMHDYLRDSSIFGINIKDEWKNANKIDYPRLKMYYNDAYSYKNKWKNKSLFDIIIDDGPHTLKSQIFAINNFPKFLYEDGILIIEDVNKNNLDKLLFLYEGPKRNINVFDWTNDSKRIDDIIITIQK
jgi:cephalosporin hydroxylase